MAWLLSPWDCVNRWLMTDSFVVVIVGDCMFFYLYSSTKYFFLPVHLPLDLVPLWSVSSLTSVGEFAMEMVPIVSRCLSIFSSGINANETRQCTVSAILGNSTWNTYTLCGRFWNSCMQGEYNFQMGKHME